MAKTKYYNLPEGTYHPDFLKALAIASHLGLMEPSELTYLLNSGTKHFDIANTIMKRVKDGNR